MFSLQILFCSLFPFREHNSLNVLHNCQIKQNLANILGSPTKPEKILTSVSLSDVIQGQSVSFLCKGNVGDPPGKYKWTQYLHDQTTMTYSDVNTIVHDVLENCTNYGTSNLTIELTASVNKAT